MQTQPFCLNTQMTMFEAVEELNRHKLSCAPVVNPNGELVGVFSHHDVMTEAWCKDYQVDKNVKVSELMTTEIISIDAKETIKAILEFMCIDKEQLYPNNGYGIASQWNVLSLEQRAKRAAVARPHTLPVLEHGHFVGIITRSQIVSQLTSKSKTKPYLVVRKKA